MTQEERDLMGYGADGNLAPKAISAEEAKKMEAEIAAKGSGVGPVWAGNTWVDKKLDKWALDQLEPRLCGCVFEVPEKPGAVMKVRRTDQGGAPPRFLMGQ
jgi:hypothetical protein